MIFRCAVRTVAPWFFIGTIVVMFMFMSDGDGMMAIAIIGCRLCHGALCHGCVCGWEIRSHHICTVLQLLFRGGATWPADRTRRWLRVENKGALAIGRSECCVVLVCIGWLYDLAKKRCCHGTGYWHYVRCVGMRTRIDPARKRGARRTTWTAFSGIETQRHAAPR